MELKLLKPIDATCPEVDLREEMRLKDPHEFSDPADFAVYQAKVFYEGLGDTGAARTTLEDALQRFPENPNVILGLAEVYSRDKGTLEKAIEFCDRGLAREPSSDYGYTIRARAQYNLGLLPESYVSAMNALQINSNNFEAGVYLGVVGFAVALAEKNEREMESSLQNMRVTLSVNPGSEWWAEIMKKHEDMFEKYKLTRDGGIDA